MIIIYVNVKTFQYYKQIWKMFMSLKCKHVEINLSLGLSNIKFFNTTYFIF